MVTEKTEQLLLDTFAGLLSRDIGKVVRSVVILGLTARYNKQKCEQLVEQVRSTAGVMDRIQKEIESKGPIAAISKEKYPHTYEKFAIVVQDCEACIKMYGSKSVFNRGLLALKYEEAFDSLNQRLDQTVKWFVTEQQTHQTIMLNDIWYRQRGQDDKLDDGLDKLKVMQEDVKALKENRMAPDDTHLENVSVGESLVEGYILAGRLEGNEVMLVATEQEKKDAAILKRLSDSESILRFHGTFSVGPQKYLVMERPSLNKPLTTLYEWKMEGHGVDDWRLKRMIALEIALGLASAHFVGILHRNMRSTNVFLTDDGHPKIFGFFKGRVKSTPSDKKWLDIDQARWAAPEMLPKDRPEYNEKCDIFSLGVIIWELITGDSPFSEFPGMLKMLAARKKDKIKLHFQGVQSQDAPFLDAFKQISLDCMNDDPEQRPIVDSVIRRLSFLAPEDMVNHVLS